MQSPVTIPPSTNLDSVVLKSPKVFKALSITQLVVGIISIICGVMALASDNKIDETGALQVGTPVPFAISGIIGLRSVRMPTPCLLIANMTLCVMSTVFSFVLLVVVWYYSNPLVLHIALAFLAFAEFSISIILCALCCQALCCKNRARPGVIMEASAPDKAGVLGLSVAAMPMQTRTADTTMLYESTAQGTEEMALNQPTVTENGSQEENVEKNVILPGQYLVKI